MSKSKIKSSIHVTKAKHITQIHFFQLTLRIRFLQSSESRQLGRLHSVFSEVPWGRVKTQQPHNPRCLPRSSCKEPTTTWPIIMQAIRLKYSTVRWHAPACCRDQPCTACAHRGECRLQDDAVAGTALPCGAFVCGRGEELRRSVFGRVDVRIEAWMGMWVRMIRIYVKEKEEENDGADGC